MHRIQRSLCLLCLLAGVSAASVVLARDADALEVRISDAGKGFEPIQVDSHNHGGLSGMRERAAWLGGRLTIETAPRAGVRITASLPIASD